MREGIAMVINSHPNMLMVAQASNGREAIECFREHKPDVTLMDLRLPDMSGIDAAVAIRTEFPEARIIILTTFDSDTDQQRALAIGASAFVLKSAPPGKLLETIHQVHTGTQKPD
jgi:DNA-binding NarL/FixJ family response regulator